MHAAGLVVAAGKGVRAGGAIAKQYASVGGKPLLRWSLEALKACPEVSRLIVVIDPVDEAMAAAAAEGLGVELVEGGAVRTASVRAGLTALSRGLALKAVLIHDAARPGLTPEIVHSLLAALEEADGAAPALPSPDALKRVDANGFVEEDVPRADLRRVQTPQAFRYEAISRAYENLAPDGAYEDDLAVARLSGLRVRLVEGDFKLAKVTFAEDFVMAAQMLAPTTPVIGAGFDAHRFGPGDHVVLCGVKIPHGAGLLGHSDADAAWHALTDAILGAIGEGDIGEHFPPNDVRWRGASSELFLRHAADLAAKAGAKIVNVDMTLMCEAPKIKPHREAMRLRTAEVLGLPLARVSVKATTTEGLGFLGRREGLAAQANVLLLLPQ
ncbi:MAG TPA: bifunctional 2-C-methyl-D-erythritol 4-phosphate cytidylyltransferase/2-C-methyl-D-erythritol 2,4-cyclodiphosphate synthase [Caulobacterales bacterium]|nr:bifunctional 2-C-methyl-D-erythritol 4-phosphate cytidylyltransferase/2-C-methyl-D-erythritol 2,4-cyclodiphosphate synthase [Caulobacterales bacterium]